MSHDHSARLHNQAGMSEVSLDGPPGAVIDAWRTIC